MAWVRDINSLCSVIGCVVLRTPDNFPTEDCLSADPLMNLERAFAELQNGVMLVKADAPDPPRLDELEVVLDQALALPRIETVQDAR